jgi:hypothetical protein
MSNEPKEPQEPKKRKSAKSTALTCIEGGKSGKLDLAGGQRIPKGVKALLADSFVKDFHEAWLESGSKALKEMAKRDPSGFVRAAVLLMPKDVLVDARGAGLVVVKLSEADMAL